MFSSTDPLMKMLAESEANERAKREILKDLKLQVAILDNGRVGTYYAAIAIVIRTPPTHEENPIEQAVNDALGIPPVISLIAHNGLPENNCKILESRMTPPVDIVPRIFDTLSSLAGYPMKYFRLLLVPLGTNEAIYHLNQEMRSQANDDLRRFPMVYYDYQQNPTPQLKRLGSLALPNPERYCEFIPGEVFTAEEEVQLEKQRTKASLCVSHGRPITAKFAVKMVNLTQGSTFTHVKYMKQTGEMVDLPITAFEQKLARVRGISQFSFTDRLRISAMQDDFNEDRLPPPAWKFSFGDSLALSTQHDFHCLYNPKHPTLPKIVHRYITDKKDLTPPMPPVYFAHIGAMDSYGVFAAAELKPNTLIGMYAGDLTDDHPNPRAITYSFQLHFPGYTYSNNQAIYAFDSGNVSTLINSAPKAQAGEQQSSAAKANIIGRAFIYKKTPLLAYFTMPGKSIPKGSQLFIDYEDLIVEECPRHFSFFSKGTGLCATEKFVEYCKADQVKGREHFQTKNYTAAKTAFKTAYHLAKAYYDQSISAKAASFRLTFASICEDLGDCYNSLGNADKAKNFFKEALDLRKLQKNSDPKRLTQLETKMQKLSSTVKPKF
jgi:tetratricopeptide (TPR) repeat protein